MSATSRTLLLPPDSPSHASSFDGYPGVPDATIFMSTAHDDETPAVVLGLLSLALPLPCFNPV
jgi:hypothetical protein